MFSSFIRRTSNIASKKFYTIINNNVNKSSFKKYLPKFMVGIAIGASSVLAHDYYYNYLDAKSINYNEVKDAIIDLLDSPDYDDGSKGPLFVRLAWHQAGTYDRHTKDGGSNGATMRFRPECEWGANAGLDIARKDLEVIKKKFPEISYADLWTLAGSISIETMGGPKIDWVPGRKDAVDGKKIVPDGRLPNASKGGDHIFDVFDRMGFNSSETVALIGAHCLGRCHTDRSGYTNAWTCSPTTFSNAFFKVLLEETWTEKKWNGPKQYENKQGDLMMLPADLALLNDKRYRKYVEEFAKDEQKFFKEFATAWKKLIELGCEFPKDKKAL